MLGKEFIIVLVIIFSGLSFTLGYFVGKSGTPIPAPPLQAIESQAQLRKQDLLPAQTPLQTLTESPVQQAVVPQIKEPSSHIEQTTKETRTRLSEIKENNHKINTIHLRQASSESQISKSAPEKSAQKLESASALEAKSAIYTVQIGAFKNISEANQLKTRFNQKGYKSYISEGSDKKAQKIFKVKTGEFKEKKEAEVLALKLKKTEGLQTYVTIKTE